MDYSILKTLLILTPVTFVLCTLGLYLIMLPKSILAKVAKSDYVLGRFIRDKSEESIKKFYKIVGILFLIVSIVVPTIVYILKYPN